MKEVWKCELKLLKGSVHKANQPTHVTSQITFSCLSSDSLEFLCVALISFRKRYSNVLSAPLI